MEDCGVPVETNKKLYSKLQNSLFFSTVRRGGQTRIDLNSDKKIHTNCFPDHNRDNRRGRRFPRAKLTTETVEKFEFFNLTVRTKSNLRVLFFFFLDEFNVRFLGRANEISRDDSTGNGLVFFCWDCRRREEEEHERKTKKVKNRLTRPFWRISMSLFAATKIPLFSSLSVCLSLSFSF